MKRRSTRNRSTSTTATAEEDAEDWNQEEDVAATGKRRSKKQRSQPSSVSSISSLEGRQPVLEQLQLLRSFVGSSKWSEIDLSTCLSQSGYRIDVAAERLMTGQFRPSKKVSSSLSSPSSHSSNLKSAATATTTVTATTTTTTTTTGSSFKPATPTPRSTTSTPPPSASPSTKTTTTTRQCESTPPVQVTPKTTPNNKTTKSKPTSSPPRKSPPPPPRTFKRMSNMQTIPKPLSTTKWMLCHRWVCNGICLQRNGSVDYQEVLHLDAPNTNSNQFHSVLHFRGTNIRGQVPKFLSYILSPLLARQLVSIHMEAVMEERRLPIGAHVAFSIIVWLPNPTAFFQLFQDDLRSSTSTTMSASKQFFGRLGGSSSNSYNPVAEAAFDLLQWAHYGDQQEVEEYAALQKSPNDEERSTSRSSNPSTIQQEWESTTTPTPTLTQQQQLPKMDPPTKWFDISNIQLRPYQSQALSWMMNRECDKPNYKRELQEQLELLVELAKPKLANNNNNNNYHSTTAATTATTTTTTGIHCDCGPVQIGSNVSVPPAWQDDTISNNNNNNNMIDLVEEQKQELTHPLWERRYLASAGPTDTCQRPCKLTLVKSFFVQPLFRMALPFPPEPPKPCRGGILADSMGLGKTVMLLSLICKSKEEEEKDSNNSSGGPTLVVTPLSLLAQWEEEIATKTSLTHLVHYGDAKQNATVDTYQQTDVILTTYGSLQGEWQLQVKEKSTSPSKQDGTRADNDSSDDFGGLFGISWNRVILDEAHSIKNSTTATSRACCQLRAERRWCVSGTIIQNSLDDVYALLKFLRHEPWCEHSFWKAAIGNKANSEKNEERKLALDRLRRVLIPIMLRRTKDTLDGSGKPILTLPPVECKTIAVEFTPAEREFYDALHRKSLNLFEGFIKAGTAAKSWLQIFSLLHRLRMTCDHVALTVKSHLDDVDWNQNIHNAENPSKKQGKKESGGSIDQEFLQRLMKNFRSMQDKSDQAFASKVANTLNDAIREKSSHLEEECAVCLDPINVSDALVTPCLHIFCKDCLLNVLRESSSANQKSLETKFSTSSKIEDVLKCRDGQCPVCNGKVDPSKILRLSASSTGKIETSFLAASSCPNDMKYKSRDGAARKVLENAVQGTSSSKLTAILKELDNVWQEEPGSKVLVFSQYLGFLDLLENSFRSNSIPFARLDGKLSLKDRIAVLNKFGSNGCGSSNDNPTPSTRSCNRTGSVLLISMKAGGVGLNLVSASSVFIADPWWNAAVEDQCVNRIHRIGQLADKVRVRKFYVLNSVEARIIQLQNKKRDMANEVLLDDDDESVWQNNDGSSSRPTLEELRSILS